MTERAVARYAGVVSRTIAFVTDAVIVVLAIAAAVTVVNVVASTVGAGPGDLARILAPTLAIAPPVLLVLYDCTLWTLTGRTPGMALLGLRVVRTDGRPVSLGQAVVRALVLVLVSVGALWSVVDRRHQGLHDKLARTVVIYDDPGSPAAGDTPAGTTAAVSGPGRFPPGVPSDPGSPRTRPSGPR